MATTMFGFGGTTIPDLALAGQAFMADDFRRMAAGISFKTAVDEVKRETREGDLCLCAKNLWS